MADWDPALYTRFEAERTRPAFDLLSRVPIEKPRLVADLGCGPGNSTALLAARWPEADVVGIDSSPAMVAEARERLPDLHFEVADLVSWQPPVAPDLIFANAVLQWLPQHGVLLPRLMECLAPGGVLAVQMPDNLDEPSHKLMQAVAAEGAWALRLANARRPALRGLDDYYDLLAKSSSSVDVWETRYYHPMPSPAHIVEWVRATGLRPFLGPLSPEERTAFVSRYEQAIDAAYPVRADGRRLLKFPRVFMVAVKAR
jgi:trans-aconitate 2-methyltransferase